MAKYFSSEVCPNECQEVNGCPRQVYMYVCTYTYTISLLMFYIHTYIQRKEMHTYMDSSTTL